MKKNNMLRLASVLLVAVLLSTCAVAGAFANYATDITTNDSAVVAKWGVKIAEDSAADLLFGDAYGADDAIVSYVANETDATLTVQADTAGKQIVAPGTSGALAALLISGKPEVDVEVTYVADLALTGWTVAGAYYCPIVITIDDGDDTTPVETFNGNTYSSISEFESAVETAIVAKHARYHTNTDLSVVADDVVVTWAWAYNTDTTKDTALGDQAAGIDGGTASQIALTVKTTITQAD